MNSIKIVEEFWERVWKARNPAEIDAFVVDDFVITTGGLDVVSRTKFKEWAAAFMAKINDLQFEVIETFQNEDGSRVASRWRIVGKNNGLLGTPPDQQPISFTGTAVWAVREDGKLCHNWVESSSFELFQQLSQSGSTRQQRSQFGRQHESQAEVGSD
jgi:SnoaL-like polyketide cyclase